MLLRITLRKHTCVLVSREKCSHAKLRHESHVYDYNARHSFAHGHDRLLALRFRASSPSGLFLGSAFVFRFACFGSLHFNAFVENGSCVFLLMQVSYASHTCCSIMQTTRAKNTNIRVGSILAH